VGFGLDALLPAWARSETQGLARASTASVANIALTIANTPLAVEGRTGHAITINDTVPAPLLRWKEGQTVRIAVTNHLDEDTSIHWHGVLLPFPMDGMPGVSFPGIAPHSTFVYEFHVRQSGTYWYHSHSGLQEQIGHYGPIVPGRRRSRGVGPRILCGVVGLELPAPPRDLSEAQGATGLLQPSEADAR
jgi:FtsP/CotA-like multicopper oxidase with cupredoxin domain